MTDCIAAPAKNNHRTLSKPCGISLVICAFSCLCAVVLQEGISL